MGFRQRPSFPRRDLRGGEKIWGFGVSAKAKFPKEGLERGGENMGFWGFGNGQNA